MANIIMNIQLFNMQYMSIMVNILVTLAIFVAMITVKLQLFPNQTH